MKHTMNFDLQALIYPHNLGDVAAMLKEAIAELQNVNAHLDQIYSQCIQYPVAVR